MISLHSQQGHRYIRSLLILLNGYNCTCLRVLVLALKGCGLLECGVNQCGALVKDMAQCTNISLTTHMAHCRECACRCAGLAHLCLHTCSDSYISSTFQGVPLLLKPVWAKGSDFMCEGSSAAFEQDGTLAIHVKAGLSGFTSHKEKGATQYT